MPKVRLVLAVAGPGDAARFCRGIFTAGQAA